LGDFHFTNASIAACRVAYGTAPGINCAPTTNEGVGSMGKGEAIAAWAVVTLEEKG